MKIAGIVCEYNPFHRAHAFQIAQTRSILGEDTAVVCAMSGNFVQRGDFAVFEKHARAITAVAGGADLVIELPLPYVLSSAEGFASGAVQLLDSLRICTHLSFGSESGEVDALSFVANNLLNPEIDDLIKKKLSSGISYAAARQKSAALLIGSQAQLLRSPNNILGIEYIKALITSGSTMVPVTIKRKGTAHDGENIAEELASASMLRNMLNTGVEPWGYMPSSACRILKGEITQGRGPVTMASSELAMLAKLRTMEEREYAELPDASEGLHLRLMRYARKEPTMTDIITRTKTKRYAMSRIRRMILCAYLGISAKDSTLSPPYIRVLAFSRRGQQLLREIADRSALPIITKPASAKKMTGRARTLFERECAATDLYVLGYPQPEKRTGGQDWRISPYGDRIKELLKIAEQDAVQDAQEEYR